jgi:hypothetical protein
MGVNTHLNADHLLNDTCSYYGYTGVTQDADTLVKTQTYDAAVTTACMIGNPSRQWQTQFPVAELVDTREIWLPEATTVKPLDKIITHGNTYRVMAVSDWYGFQSALIRRVEGFT